MSDTWCVHRTPFSEEIKTCKVGFDFHQFPKPHRLMPCLGETPEARAGCPKYQAYTAQELAEREERFAASINRMAVIRDAIIKTKLESGRIACPACKTGKVSFSVSSYNGHVHAQCSTPGCASWME